MNFRTTGLFVVASLLVIGGCKKPDMETKKPADVDAKIKRFAAVEITADISKLSDGDRKALSKLFEATKIIDKLYPAGPIIGSDLVFHKKF